MRMDAPLTWILELPVVPPDVATEMISSYSSIESSIGSRDTVPLALVSPAGMVMVSGSGRT